MTGPDYREPTHPITGAALSELERVLVRFRLVAHEAQTIIRGFHITARGGQINDVLDGNLMFTVLNHGQLITCKFLEVWDDLGQLVKSDARALAVRKALTPFVRRIETWPAFEDYRNTSLAHAYLNRKRELVLPWHHLDESSAPTYHAEVILLLHCVNYAVLGVLLAFQSEYSGVKPLLYGFGNAPPPSVRGITQGSEIASQIQALAAEVDPLLHSVGIEVSGPLAEEFRLALKEDP